MNGPAFGSTPDDSVARHWRRLNESRLDWAHRAHRRFLASLDARTRSCFADHDGEASVVLFGRTQVGKTMLLLHLMGIAEKETAYVSMLLRGGRASGQSATSTAMQYQRSPDDNWRIAIDGVARALTDKALIEELARIRNGVEAGRFEARAPVTVSIPGNLFGNGADARPNVRILDLPGDNPGNAMEAEHVRLIAERYVPHADLILIVGKADDLSFLNPSAFQLPGIRDWRFTPTRFRVITTYSFSLQSLVDWATRQRALDADRFRARLMEQIATHGVILSHDAQDGRLYFPLEFGDSWDGVRRADPALYDKLNPVVAQLMDELRTDIAAAAQPHGRIRQAAYAHVVAARIKEETLANMGDLLIVGEETHAKATATAQVLCDLHNKAVAALAATAACAFTRDDEKTLRKQAAGAIAFNTDGVGKLGTNTSDFRSLIHRCSSSLSAASVAFAPAMLAPMMGLRPPCDAARARKVANDCFDALRERMSGYLIDEYYPTFSDDFKIDKARLRNAIEEAAAAVAGYAATCWIETIRARIAAVALEREQLARTVAARQQARAHADVKQQQAQLELGTQRDAIECFARVMDADIERGRLFKNHLLEAFEGELAERKRAIDCAATSSERWIELLGAVGLCDEKDKLLSGH